MTIIGPGPSRRAFLRAAGVGALGATAAGGSILTVAGAMQPAAAATTSLGLAATDGYITMPGREDDRIACGASERVVPGLAAAAVVAGLVDHDPE